MNRAGRLYLALGAASLALLSSVWILIREKREDARPVAVRADSVADPTKEPDESRPDQGERLRPFVRAPMPFDPGTLPQPIEVVVERRLVPGGEVGDSKVFLRRLREPDADGRLVIQVGLTNGFGGTAAEIALDPETKSASARCWWFGDVGPPFEHYWSGVKGRVRISGWELKPNMLLEVDLHGEEGGIEQSLRVCAPLRGLSGF